MSRKNAALFFDNNFLYVNIFSDKGGVIYYSFSDIICCFVGVVRCNIWIYELGREPFKREGCFHSF